MLKLEGLTLELLTHEFTEYSANEDRHLLRFGQYLCNKYLRDRETFPELYYEEHNNRAFVIAWEHLVENL